MKDTWTTIASCAAAIILLMVVSWALTDYSARKQRQITVEQRLMDLEARVSRLEAK